MNFLTGLTVIAAFPGLEKDLKTHGGLEKIGAFPMKDSTYKTVLFWSFLLIFLATAVLVLLSLANIVKVQEKFTEWMFRILIVEVAASVFTFWKTLTAVSFHEPPQVSGDWEYECIRDDSSYKHGGICRIEVRKAELGWEFTIQGKRTWISKKSAGEWKREELEAQFSWENTWGTFTGAESLRYAYSIKVGDELVQGYGWAAIKKNKEGKAVLLEGNFFQLPPNNPFYGFQRFTRQV